MTSEFDKRVNRVFYEALGYPEDDREQRVRSLCGDDPALLAKVLSLLESAREADQIGFMETLDPVLKEESLDQGESIPKSIGKYEIRGIVGRGGMGIVYKAYDPDIGREVAIKRLQPSAPMEGSTLERFKQEIRAIGQLHHANIVTAYDTFEEDGIQYLVMEYVGGQDLESLVERAGPLSVSEACDVIRQAAEGLAHADAKGIVHRDVKPSNLLVAADETVKLLDFGIAALNDRQSQPDRLTSHGLAMGTVDYMAPEQQEGMREVDVRADIYSLGCTFYYLLTGRPPFARHADVIEKMMAHRKEEPPTAKSAHGPIPAEITKVLRRMMAKHPHDRFATPDEVVIALTNAAEAAKHQPWSIMKAMPAVWLVISAICVLIGVFLGLNLSWTLDTSEMSPDLVAAVITSIGGAIGILVALRKLIGVRNTIVFSSVVGAGGVALVIYLIFVRDTFIHTPRPDPPLPPVASAPLRSFIGTEQMIRTMHEYLKQRFPLSEDDRSKKDRNNQRFFTLVHLHNRQSVSEEELGFYRDALKELLETFGPRGGTVGIKPIDEARTIYAIDLGDLDWDSGDKWETICAEYPYGLRYDMSSIESLKDVDGELWEITGTEVSAPYVRADWFVVATSQLPLLRLCVPDRDLAGDTLPDAVDWVRQHYSKNLDLETVAAELGQEDVEAFRNRIKSTPRLRTACGLQALLDDQIIARADWTSREYTESPFQKAAQEIDGTSSWNGELRID